MFNWVLVVSTKGCAKDSTGRRRVPSGSPTFSHPCRSSAGSTWYGSPSRCLAEVDKAELLIWWLQTKVGSSAGTLSQKGHLPSGSLLRIRDQQSQESNRALSKWCWLLSLTGLDWSTKNSCPTGWESQAEFTFRSSRISVSPCAVATPWSGDSRTGAFFRTMPVPTSQIQSKTSCWTKEFHNCHTLDTPLTSPLWITGSSQGWSPSWKAFISTQQMTWKPQWTMPLPQFLPRNSVLHSTGWCPDWGSAFRSAKSILRERVNKYKLRAEEDGQVYFVTELKTVQNWTHGRAYRKRSKFRFGRGILWMYHSRQIKSVKKNMPTQSSHSSSSSSLKKVAQSSCGHAQFRPDAKLNEVASYMRGVPFVDQNASVFQPHHVLIIILHERNKRLKAKWQMRMQMNLCTSWMQNCGAGIQVKTTKPYSLWQAVPSY